MNQKDKISKRKKHTLSARSLSGGSNADITSILTTILNRRFNPLKSMGASTIRRISPSGNHIVNCLSCMILILLMKQNLSAQYSIDYLREKSDYEKAKSELRFDDAIGHAIQMKQIAERDSGRYSAFYLESAEPEIQMHFDMGEYSGLDSMINELIRIASVTVSDSSAKSFLYPAYLAYFHYVQSDFVKAAEISIQQLEKWSRQHGKDNPEFGEFAHNAGASLNAAGHTDRALPYLQQSIENAKEFSADSITYGERLITMGDYYIEMGLYNDALYNYESAMKFLAPHFEEDPVIYNIVLCNISMTLAELGQYKESIETGLECLDNIRKMNGTDSEFYATANSGIIMSYSDLGQIDKALQVCSDSKLIIDSIYGKSHPRYWMLSIDEADIYRTKKDFQTALDRFLNLKNLVDSAGGQDWNQYDIILSSIGLTYYGLKNYDQALYYIDQGISRLESLEKFDSPDYARQLLNKSQILIAGNHHAEALICCQKSMAIVESQLGKKHKTYINCLSTLAQIHYITGENELLAQDLKQLSDLLSFRIHEYFSFLPEKERQLFLNDTQFYYSLINNLAAGIYDEYPEISEVMYNNSLSLKGMLARKSSQLREDILKSNNSELTGMYEEWIALKSFISKQSALPVQSRVIYMDSLLLKADQLEKSLLEGSSLFNANYHQLEVNMKDVQHSLQPGDATIEFITYNASGIIPAQQNDYAALLLLHGDKRAHFVPLCAEAKANKLINYDSDRKADYVDRIYQINGRGFVLDEAPVASTYDLFWHPLDSLLQGVQRIYYSPSGLLYRINLNAVAVSDTTILSDHYDLIQMESTRNLVNKKKSTQEVQGNAILFGGIAYTLPSPQSSNQIVLSASSRTFSKATSFAIPEDARGQYEQWNYLPGTEKEVNRIAEILSKKNFSVTRLTGTEATEESFVNCCISGQSPGILHISTHGFFFNEPRTQDQHSDAINEYHRSPDPMIRSGILFAGANDTWKSAENLVTGIEDGIVTAKDISQMNLAQTELVVLSACETGLGDILGDEGVYGLRRAFEIAGAQHLIMSLWQVPDKQTSELMILFYSKWINEELSIHDAFNAAQRTMREKYDNPYFWAGFVLCE
jgi:CHAT domain-containing protein